MTKTFVQVEETHLGFYVPSFEILVNKKDLVRHLYMEVSSVQVDNVLKGGDRFSFTVNSTFNFEEKDFEHLEDTFGFGNSVLIKMGYQKGKPEGTKLPEMIM